MKNTRAQVIDLLELMASEKRAFNGKLLQIIT